MKQPGIATLIEVFALCALASCGGGSSSAPPPPPPPSPPPAPAPVPVSTRLDALVANGQLPTLDRSATLAGIDADGNGIRDDVDAWIAARNVAAAPASALRQHARSLQATLAVDVADAAAVRAAEQSLSRSMHCVYGRLSPDDAGAYAADLKKITMNTKARVIAYVGFAHALNGSVISMPRGDTCD